MTMVTTQEVGGAPCAGTAGSAEDPRLGSLVGATYRVVAHLGSGGMGDVYEVEHLRLAKRFAAKFLRANLLEDAAALQRFEREAQAMARLHSNHVATIVDLGTDGSGTPFLVMERLYGSDLRRLLLRYGSLSAPRAVRLVVDAALGVRAVHEAGLVHGDVKPANLFVSSDDRGADVCKVLDFGLARARRGRTAHAWAEAGTIRYMAPEQLREGGLVDVRTDIHALASVLYECLAGRPPHEGDCVERVIYSIMHERPRPLRELGVTVPAGLERQLLRALAIEPSERFACADAFIEALEPFASGRGIVSPVARASAVDVTATTRSFARRPGRSRSALVGLVALTSLIGATAVAVPRLIPSPPGPVVSSVRPVRPPSAPTRSPALGVASEEPAPSPAAATPAGVAPVVPATTNKRSPTPVAAPRRSPEERHVPLGEFETRSPYETSTR